MPRVDFDSLPDDARVWVFGAERTLSDDEARQLLGPVDAFLDGWKAHGSPLSAAREWRYDTFLVVGVDERTVPPSGCSIDAMVRVLKEIEARITVPLVANHPVWYREGDVIRRVDRPTFRALARDGAVGPETVVFDNTVTRLVQLRQGAWERPARDSWHGKAFFRAAV